MTRLMLCQDCLAISPCTEAGHLGEEHCKCGGDWCGCDDCAAYAAKLQQNHEQREAQGSLFDDTHEWHEDPDRGWCLRIKSGVSHA